MSKLNERIKKTLSPVDEKKIYDEFLDECHGSEVQVAGMTFTTSFAFRRLDPICYDLGLSDYLDSYSEDFYELDGEYYWQNEVDKLKKEMDEE